MISFGFDGGFEIWLEGEGILCEGVLGFGGRSFFLLINWVDHPLKNSITFF